MKIFNFSIGQLLFFTACFLGLVFFIYVGVFSLFNRPVPRPQQGNFNANYTNFDKLVPGKSTKQDIVKQNGPFEAEKTIANKTYLYYTTPSDTIKNVAVLENNVLTYATEEVFSTYRGAPEDYNKKYGQPEIIMYDKTDDVIQWYVYPTKGIAYAIAPFENIIVKITYFVPQDKNTFLNSLADELGLVKNKPTRTEAAPTESPSENAVPSGVPLEPAN